MNEVSEITITVPAKEAVNRHIESLQSTLTKRNEQIDRLEARLREAEAGEPNQRVIAMAYKRGWMDACNHLISSSHKAVVALERVKKEAYDVYLKSESKDFEEA